MPRRVTAKSRLFTPYGRRPRSGRYLPRIRGFAAGVLQLERRYAGLGLSELRELRQLREENRKLKTLVADLTVDKHILQEVLSKKG
jgi:hypothetical protein